MKTVNLNSFNLCCSDDISENDLNSLVATISDLGPTAPSKTPRTLLGRGEVTVLQLPDSGSAVVKRLRRCGLFGRLVSKWYLRSGESRPEQELRMLKFLQSLGLSAPEPLAAVTRGGLLYEGWLVMRELPVHKSYAELCLSDEPKVRESFDALLVQLAGLIKNRIFHVDLHPGNVVLTDKSELYVLDFDKAKIVHLAADDLRDRYLRRWRRAVITHGLPEFLSELMCLGLRRRFE